MLPHQALQQIKSSSWSNRQEYLKGDKNRKFLNAYSLYEALKPPKNWEEIAYKCSINPKHEHFGKTTEEILTIWQTKRDYKADEGNTLDDYITLKLKQNDLSNLLTFKQRNIENHTLVQKTDQVDKLYEQLLKKLEYIDSEIWLTSKLGLNLRCDAMFLLNQESEQHLVIAEWKSLDNLSMSNHWNKLEGPLKCYDDCDAVKFSLQTNLYKYVVESYNIGFELSKIHTPIFNFNTLTYQKIESKIPYDKSLIEEILAYCHEKTLTS
jgi:hypothetical protein